LVENPVHTGPTPEKFCFTSEYAMPPIVKENEIPAAKPETAGRPASIAPFPSEAAVKQQPVALEVMVTVNGVRTVEGSDKREPFSENTKTILVFGTGAVIRLSSSVAPGQLLFLTNEKTRKEIVCQVVKSKNYRNVSGYVELEFTEPAVGFWGMRFPGDRITSTPPAAPPKSPGNPSGPSSAPIVPRPVVPSVGTSPANSATKTVDKKPLAPAVAAKDSKSKFSETRSVAPAAPFTRLPSTREAKAHVAPVSANSEVKVDALPVKPVAPESTLFDLPRDSESKASILEPPPAPSASPMIILNSQLADFEAKSAAPPAGHATHAPVANDPETVGLKQQTARLQEQLSTLLFTDTAPAKPVQKAPNAPVIATPKPMETAAKVLEIAKTGPESVRLSEPAKISHAPVPSALDIEELKIPAWLEPLARNATAPVSTQELIEREKAKRLVEQPAIAEIAQPPAAVNEENIFEVPVPTFGNGLPIDGIATPGERSSRSSGKGVLLGAIAAGLLLLAGGGVWYARRQSSGVYSGAPSAGAAQTSAVSIPAAPSQPLVNAPLQTNPSTQTNLAAQSAPPVRTITVGQADSVPNHAKVEPASVSATPVRNLQSSSKPTNAAAVLAASDQPLPAPVQVKKPLLGQIHFAAPKVSKHRNLPDAGETETGLALSEGQSDSNAEVLGTGFPVGTKQPVAPTALPPVGGDVKQAKLTSSVAPVYPALAKSQHVSGDVRLDALIDANGRVTTMKIVSGPMLLHQAAMDALRQWRYRPATLDGKPVPMHLTVTIQFHLQ
jgi:TonB family protein